jgi:hypothetical protein
VPVNQTACLRISKDHNLSVHHGKNFKSEDIKYTGIQVFENNAKLRQNLILNKISQK